MAKRIKFSTCSATKSFATAENAEKAFQKLYAEYDLRFIVVKLDENNYEEIHPKHMGRYIPVCIDSQKGIECGVHWNFHVI